jgi:mono/diheme cytochrome c family protein
MTRSAAALLGVALVAVALGGQVGEPLKPGKLPKDEQAALVPGLTFRLMGPGEKPIDVHRVRLAALHVPEGTPPSPFVKPGPFVARFSGYLKAPLRSEYQFQIDAKGNASLRINGKEVLRADNQTSETTDPVELARGYNRIDIAFTAPAKGDATLRVGWVGEGFNLEPLPPDVLFSRGDEAEVVAHGQIRDGRLMFATHGCQRCHALPDGVTANKDGMPELGQTAPSLEAAGARFGAAWLARWILNPRDLRPQATMPAVLHGEMAPQQAADIAAFLTSESSPGTGARPKGQAGQGEKLFRTLGCLACHHFNDPKEEEQFDRLPLYFVKDKYPSDALEDFLMAPHHYYAWSRMPDFKLNGQEAAHLAAYLREQAKGTSKPGVQGNVERGKVLFETVGCAKCHVLKTGDRLAEGQRLPLPGKNAIANGCLADDGAARKSAPDYGFVKEKRSALRSFLSGDVRSLAQETASEFSQRQVANLKCTACHRRDGGTSRWFQVMEEEGTLPEHLPLLTWAGEKLQPAWTQKLLAGGIDHRARPWLKARMPAFPARADLLAVGLSHEHGFRIQENDRPAADAGLADIGKKLLPQMGGLNCIQCHGVGSQPAVAPFEAPGINLLDAALRLRYSYYQRWMLDPPRVDPTTKMVKLAADGKTTGIRDVFDGDAHRQFDALWQFIQTLPAKKD